MRGNSQNGGQTTKSLLIKPQCSGVPIQQAVSLSSSFPRHCLLFVYAFSPEMPESARSEELPLPPVSCIQNRPGFHHGNRGGSFALWVLFSGAHAKPCEGAFGKPRGCREKVRRRNRHQEGLGSPPRMQGKDKAEHLVQHHVGITPAYAGKSGYRRSQPDASRDHPRACGEKIAASMCPIWVRGSPPRMRGKGHLTLAVSHMHRINPAYAGKSSPSCRGSWRCRDHPRVCGENAVAIIR